jgi:hypothetical protein
MENQLLDSDMLENKEGKSLSALLSNGYETNSVAYIKKGFELFKQDIGSFIAFLFIVGISEGIISAIPFLKGLAGPLVAPIMAGSFLVAKKIDKNEMHSFSDFFEGTKNYLNLFLVTFIPGLIIALIFLVLCGWDYFKLTFLGGAASNNMNELISTMTSHGGGIGIAGLIALILYILFMLGTLLVLFENFTPVRALDISRKLISKKFFNWVGFMFLLVLFNMVGLICLVVGLLVTIPSSICAMYVAYEDVVGLNLRD